MDFNVDIAGEYGDEDTSITLLDGTEEIVTWISDEWREDPSLVVVIAEAIAIGYRDGVGALRQRFNA
jgi:hypothetical protein